MASSLHTGAAFMEGRAYSIGREGHIRLDDSSVSRGHAELRFTDGKIFLRDLNSTNGTYLVGGSNAGRFTEGFVQPNQRVMIGAQVYTIRNLLAKVGVYVSLDPRIGLIVRLTRPHRKSLDFVITHDPPGPVPGGARIG